MKFTVDVTEIIEEFNLLSLESEVLTKQVLDDVTALVMRNWQNVAMNQLGSTRQEYIRSIKWIESGKLKNTLVLLGRLPNMIESGATAFDMKEGFEKSSKVKFNKKGGWYLTIPLRFGTPSASSSSSFFASIMPESIYELAKGMEGKRTSISGAKKGGSSLKAIDIPKNLAIPKTRAQIITSNKIYEPYKHKGSIYEGITKNTTTYEKTTQSTYNSFRRVGKNSDPNAFIHKGIQARNLADKAFRQTDFQTQVDNSIDRFLSNL